MALTSPVSNTYGRVPTKTSPEALIRSHMPLVRKIAWHVHAHVSSAMEIEDLIQIGMIALVEAANGYEDRGHAFATYANMRVRGAMIDHLRRQATVCRSAMARRRELAGVRQRLQSRLGREPQQAEMAAEMGMKPEAYRALVDEVQAVQFESLDDVYSETSMWFADLDERADETIDRARLQKVLADHIRSLPQREAMVLQLYFVEEMNLEEIGATLDIGAARVCQIKKAALDKLRKSLADFT